MSKSMFKAGFVFLFMAFLAAQAWTGFMHDMFAGAVYPRAMRAFDWIIETFFVGPLGRTGGAVLLLGLGIMLAALTIRRGVKGASA
jgi:hypothetical protein